MRARAVGTGLLAVSLVAAVCGGWAEARGGHGAALDVTVLHVALTVVGLSWAVVGATLTWLRPRNVLGWLFLVVGTTTQLSLSADALARLRAPGAESSWIRPGELLLSVAGGFLIFVLLGLLPVLYPSGQLPRGVSRVAAAVVVAGAAMMQTQWLLSRLDDAWAWPFSPAPGSTQPAWLVWAPAAVYLSATVAVWVLCVVRLARARRPERQQLALLLTAVVVVMLTQALGSSTTAQWLQAVGLYLLPAATAVGILRYRLLGIEIVLRRGLVYAVLTAGIVAAHALVAAVTGARLTGGALPGVVAAAAVAVGLTPLRDRLQLVVDRVLYGRRADPFGAVADLGDRVATAGPTELLDAVLTGVREAVRATGARIDRPDGTVLTAVGASHAADALAVPLTVGGEPLGVLRLAARSPGERYSAADERLLVVLATQVAVVVRAFDLAAELEHQRNAVLDARLQERDRLRRDLHDGLGPALTGIGLGLQALEDLAAQDRSRAELTSTLRGEVADAITDVRRILQDLRPAPLAERGLARALSDRIGATPIPVDVAVGALPRLHAPVEDAVYRVALEAVTNVLRHSGATRASVDLWADGSEVTLRVADDGAGFTRGAVPGIGLTSMRERADLLGGRLDVGTGPSGTTVTLALPLAVLAAAPGAAS
ncbi:sensor histidine kinase [Georgenia subflava]|uniref:histidine kinase n=1 Tax=Georgenia subflava TaxID=1622177 RepID=A0A6N7EHX4_9MICO|nr:GAF domain-containing sensor histidine kinase [Georgenia subflava]MPV37992.1 GAF domain-containing protein [Georgenia subflava]